MPECEGILLSTGGPKRVALGTPNSRTGYSSSPPQSREAEGVPEVEVGVWVRGGGTALSICCEYACGGFPSTLEPGWVNLRPVPLKCSDIFEMGSRAPSGRPAVATECCSNIKLSLSEDFI